MKLRNIFQGSKYENMCEYFCEITDELDKLAGIKNDDDNPWRHYVVADKFCIKNKCLAIRIPGGTVGGIRFDDNGVITNVEVDTNYVVKTYPKLRDWPN